MIPGEPTGRLLMIECPDGHEAILETEEDSVEILACVILRSRKNGHNFRRISVQICQNCGALFVPLTSVFSKLRTDESA